MTNQPSPQPEAGHADRRHAFAQRIFEYWNSDIRWADAHPHDRIAYRADADIAMAAADALAGISSAPPVRADLYREVADRVSLYADTQKDDAPVIAQLADKIREWADRIAADAR